MFGLIEGLIGLIFGLISAIFGLVLGVFGLVVGILASAFVLLLLVGFFLFLPILVLIAIF